MHEILFERCRTLVTTTQPDGVSHGTSLLLRGGEVAAHGDPEQVRAQVEDPTTLDVVDARTRLVMPGLVNAHNHNAWGVVMLAPYAVGDDEPDPYLVLDGDVVLEQFVLAPMAWFDHERTRDLTQCGLLDQLRHGTTTTTDAHHHPDALYDAAVEAGIRTVLHPQMLTSIQIDGLDEQGYLDQAEHCLRDFHLGGSELVSVGVHPSMPWNCTTRLLVDAKALANRYDAQFVTHLYEVPEERTRPAEVWPEHGSGLAHLDALGLLDEHSLFFHGIELDDAEIDRLAAAQCALVHNPQLNVQLFGRTGRVQRWLDAGVTTGLGSDYGQFDLFSAMQLAGLFHRARQDGAAMDPWDLWTMATAGGAAALGMGDRVGRLEVGMAADVISVDLDHQPGLLPWIDDAQWLATLITTQAARLEVAESVVGGRFLRRDGRFTTLDEAELLGRGREWSDRFRSDFAQMRRDGVPWHRKVHEMFARI